MGGYRLSPQQQHLWRLQETHLDYPHSVSAVLMFEEVLDAVRIQRALVKVIDRHEILRTVFRPLGALQFPVQVIRPDADVWLPAADSSEGVEASDWSLQLDKIYRDFRGRTWDVQNGPLIQARIVSLPASRQAVLIRLSKFCSDKAGLRNVILQMLQIYKGSTLHGPEQPPQYADVSEYLNEVLELEDTAVGRQFWNRWRAELLPPLRLATHPVSDDETDEGCLRWNLDFETVARVEELAAHTGTAVTDIVMAGWQVVLARSLRQEEFTLGIVCSGRRLEGLENTPGLFERTLPLPCRITREQPFKELVRHVARNTEQLAQWQDYFSYGAIGENTTAPIAFEYCALPPLPADDLTIAAFTIDESLYPHQLKLSCFWNVKSPLLQISYQHGALSERDVAALGDQLSALLLNAAASPSAPAGKLSTLSPAAKDFLLHQLNRTEVMYSSVPFTHARFELQARQSPAQPALVAGEMTLTYGELDERATRLADVLKSRGIGPESAVVVSMERCPELLISLLGILKSGGFYIPLDPGYPAERLAFVLRDSRAALVLSKAEWNSRFAASQVPILNLDDDWMREEVSGNTKAKLHPHNLAYTIYTSGSTGQPKGVAVSHAALANYLSWCEQKYDLAKGRGVIVHSPIGFDLTVTTLLAPLSAGQTIILVEGEDPTEGLARLLRRDAHLTLLKITPAHLQALSQMLDPKELSGAVDTVIIGGEALLSNHVGTWQVESPQTRLINEYGPTETTVGCSIYEMPRSSLTSGPVPIGKPIANAKLYVFDAEMQPLPIKSVGELYVGGVGLARGYLGQPALTAERFLPHPFSTSPGGRLYKTGDMAQVDADGTLHFLGRADDQIKLRGYRIELGEIEYILRQHPGVREAAVVLKDCGDQKQLVAYVALTKPVAVTKPGQPAIAGLQNFLLNKLPEYMVPTQMIVLDQLPLTFHGKVDKRSLPGPNLQSSNLQPKYVAPRNAKEQILADLWARALGLERVGVRDNFFELGGDSIISIQIVNRAKQLGLAFTPRQLFHHRTIAELAEVVKTDSDAAPIPAKVLQSDVKLTPIQRWFFEQNFACPHHWNQAMLFEAHEEIDAALLGKALSAVLEQHDALRLRFGATGSIRPSLVAEAGVPHITVLNLTRVAVEQHSELLEKFAADIQSGLDLFQGPVMRVGLVRMHGARDRILWVVHHLSVDVVSWGILLADLTAAYRQLKQGAAVHLHPRTSSFQEWSLRLHQHADSEDIRREAHYWLSPARRNCAKLPVDFPKGQNLESSAQILWCSLNSQETSGLMQQVPRAHHTMINDVLLTALMQSFYNWTNERSLTLDLENHGREELFEDVDLSRTVGWFTCIFPVTLGLASPYDCVQNLRAVKEQIRSISNGGVGYGLLRHITNDPEVHNALQQLPQPEINFNYLGRSGQKIDDKPLFASCDGVLGPSRNPCAHRAYLLEVTGGVNRQGELRMAFIYSRNLHRETSIQKLADGFVEALREIVRSSSDQPVVPSLVDLSMTQLNNRDLNRLVEELSRSEETGE